jgi:hypothetical protein
MNLLVWEASYRPRDDPGRIASVRRLGGFLLLFALAIPASLGLPSTRTAQGEACAMACDHGTGMACCCSPGGAGSLLRRCPTEADWFLQSPATRVVVPSLPDGPVAPPFAGFLALLTAGFVLRVLPERPDPVPKLLS